METRDRRTADGAEGERGVMEIVKTFTYAGRAFALMRDARGDVALVKQIDGKYHPVDGTSPTAREAWAYAARKWPEYVEARRG